MSSGNPLVQASLDLAASLTAEDRYRRLLSAVRQMIPADAVVISRLAADGLRPIAFDGLKESFREQLISRDSGPHARLLEAGHPVRVEQADPELFPSSAYSQSEARALGVWMGVPLLVEGEKVGTLAMSAEDPRAFDAVEDDTLMAFGALAAAALRTAWLIDSLAQERDALQEHAALEALVLAISARFIDLPPAELQQGIDDALQQIGEYAGVDRSYIAVVHGELGPEQVAPETYMPVLHEWNREGVEGSAATMERVVRTEAARRTDGEARAWMIRQMHEPGLIRINHLEDLPDGADAVRWRWNAQDCRSVLVVPLETSDRTFGLVGFDTVRQERRWSDETVNLLRTVGYVLASAIQRKRGADQLAAVHQNLERMVEARTRQLQEKQAQLVQSEKMAALGQLVAGIAHEVNTPLGAINSNNDTLKRSLGKLREQLGAGKGMPRHASKLLDIAENLTQVSEDAIQRITRIVGSLRNFARLDQAEVEPVDLHEGIESTLTLVHHKIRRRITVERDFGDLPAVHCHANQINQVFMNLLVNAVHAIGDKGEIRISTRSVDDRVSVAIQDDGCGIEKEHMARIFDPGFTTKGVGVGTGLGLSIVHQILEEHAGTIEVESEPGEGTTVTVTLPVAHPNDH